MEGGHEVDAAAVGADGPADGLAVARGLREQARNAGLLRFRGGAALLPLPPDDLRQLFRRFLLHRVQEAAQGAVEVGSADLAEDPAECPLARRVNPAGQRIRPAAQQREGVLRAVAGPLRDRGRRVVPGGGKREDRQGEHELQRVPPACPFAGVRDGSQPVTQAAAGHIATCGKGLGNGGGRSCDQGG